MQSVPRLYETFQPSHYELTIELDRPGRRFSGHVTIRGKKVGSQPHIVLHAKDLAITDVHLDDDSGIPFSFDEFDQLVIDHEVPAGEHTLSLEFSGDITDGMHGLYPCYYEVDGTKKELLATQFESHHAREVFPCIDEPEAKSTYDLTLTSEAGVAVLSNMPIRTQDTHDDRTVTSFETSPRMSTYLLAFVVGDLQRASATTKSGVEVGVWATKAQPADSLAFPLEVAVGCIDFFDDYFGVPYPLPKADHIALPDFSSGAMENWGLITYREIALLVDKRSSVSTKEYVASVIAHETSHQWFGNLVTMRWWDDLWLNESFATIMEYVAVDALYPQWQAWNTFASQETLSALRRDQIAGVQAVKCQVNHPDEISTLFDPSIVYAKGGRLLKMLRSYIGEEAFREGLKLYFSRHAYGNTEGTDLWNAFTASSGKDIAGFMERWLTQPGLPLIRLETTDDGYRLSQERLVIGDNDTSSVWPVPLFSANPGFPELLEEREIVVSAPHELPLLNRDNDTHAVFQYDETAWQLIRDALANGSLSPVARLALLHETSLLTRAGKADTATLLPLLRSYTDETSEPVWNIIAMVIGDLKRFVEDNEATETQLKKLVARVATPLYEKLGFEQSPAEPEQDTKLRATILGMLSYAEKPEVIEQCLGRFRSANDLATLPSETRGIIFSIASKHGTREDFDRLLALHDQTANAELRDDVTAGLTASKTPEHIDRLLARLTEGSTVKQQDVFRWFIYLLRNRYAREQAWRWMEANWSWIEETFRGDKSYDDYARYSANVLSTRAWLDRYRAFFEPKQIQTSLKRAIEIGLVEIASRADWIERDSESVRTTLAQETA